VNPIDFLLHSDKKLLELVSTYGSWVYGILFAIVCRWMPSAVLEASRLR